jgi:hypothetical protein
MVEVCNPPPHGTYIVNAWIIMNNECARMWKEAIID